MASIVDILAAAYDVDLGDLQWFDGVLRASRPHLDHGLGVFGFRFDTRRPEAKWCSEPVAIGSPPGFAAPAKAFLSQALGASLNAAMRHSIFFNATPRISSTSEAMFGGRSIQDDPTFGPTVRQIGFSDFFGMRCSDLGGTGCVVGALTPEVVRTTPLAQHRWSRIAAHIDAALRLRAAVAGGKVDAVFTPRGRVEHAEPAAVERLDELRGAVEKLRWIQSSAGRKREREDEALDLWRVLVRARWSLVERVESGGRRRVVAHRNPIVPPDMAALSQSETVVAYYVALARSNKLIAYELGLAEGTVASLVARLRAKLGAESRAELVKECARRLESGFGVTAAETSSSLASAKLTATEKTVAALAARGLSNAEIATRQGASRRTVENQLAAIYRKLGVGSRAELTRLSKGPRGT